VLQPADADVGGQRAVGEAAHEEAVFPGGKLGFGARRQAAAGIVIGHDHAPAAS
jgi:hypothetical protein